MNHDMNNEQHRHDRQPGAEKEIRENILSPSQWVRILLMIGFGILSWLLRFAQIVITVIQILFALITGRPNDNMTRAGTLLALYQAQIWFYLSYSSDQRPYPFNDLPDSGNDLDASMKNDPGDDDGGGGGRAGAASSSDSPAGQSGQTG